jgi:chromosome segregation ATPase
MEFELAKQSNETLSMKSEMLDKELNELKAKLLSEVDRRRAAENNLEEEEKSKAFVENELRELKKICLKYENAVSSLNTELEHKDNELITLKETLGEDSPLVDIAEVKAKLMNAEETVTSLESRVESLSLENTSLSRK